MKYHYIAVTVEQDRNESILIPTENAEPDIGLYAFVVKCSSADNLKSVLESIGGLVHANIFPTKKEAESTANYWNTCYKINGSYFFDSVPLF